jgi:dTDP-4-amino-4,6-dideoxygalactose transaminase
MSEMLALGGFFPLELPRQVSDAAKTGGLLEAWTNGLPFAAFSNARSALSALIIRIKPTHVWLPSFVCTAVAEAVPKSVQRFYRIDGALTADIADLAQAAAGDVVLGVNYFGFVPDRLFLRFVKSRPEIVFVEDCAHCAVPGTAWGDWRLFSPRKVVGVADGGILVGTKQSAEPPQPTCRPNNANSLWRAPLLRFEDPLQEDSAKWHSANQAKETDVNVTNAGSTRLTLALLRLYDPQDIALRRRENFAVLKSVIGEHLFPLRMANDSVPFTFPVQLEPAKRDEVLRNLHAKGIFSAVHWKSLPIPRSDYPQAHLLSRSLISLPCDQRYEPAQMEFVAEVFRQSIR